MINHLPITRNWLCHVCSAVCPFTSSHNKFLLILIWIWKCNCGPKQLPNKVQILSFSLPPSITNRHPSPFPPSNYLGRSFKLLGRRARLKWPPNHKIGSLVPLPPLFTAFSSPYLLLFLSLYQSLVPLRFVRSIWESISLMLSPFA